MPAPTIATSTSSTFIETRLSTSSAARTAWLASSAPSVQPECSENASEQKKTLDPSPLPSAKRVISDATSTPFVQPCTPSGANRTSWVRGSGTSSLLCRSRKSCITSLSPTRSPWSKLAFSSAARSPYERTEMRFGRAWSYRTYRAYRGPVEYPHAVAMASHQGLSHVIVTSSAGIEEMDFSSAIRRQCVQQDLASGAKSWTG